MRFKNASRPALPSRDGLSPLERPQIAGRVIAHQLQRQDSDGIALRSFAAGGDSCGRLKFECYGLESIQQKFGRAAIFIHLTAFQMAIIKMVVRPY
jgi:hypothetical protein